MEFLLNITIFIRVRYGQRKANKKEGGSIGNEKQYIILKIFIAGDRKEGLRRATERPLKSTFGVSGEGDYAVFVSDNLSFFFFSSSHFASIHCIASF